MTKYIELNKQIPLHMLPKSQPDLMDIDVACGILKRAARVVERMAKHSTYGSQELWDLSHRIKAEAGRILVTKESSNDM